MKIVILSGGGGQRLWPISRKSFPKQFLHFGDGKSLLQKTVERFSNAPFCDEIFIVTNDFLEPLVKKQIKQFEGKKELTILKVPSPKNTGPAISFAVKEIYKKTGSKNTHLLFVPSDHFMESKEVFFERVQECARFASEGKIVTFGINPYEPETGYGYIKKGNELSRGIYDVEKFVEKPNKKLAEKYLRDGNFLWNSGMFAFSVETFEKECLLHCPEIMGDDFNTIPSLSIDYALMEKTKNIVVSPLDISWSDVGSWHSVHKILEKDHNNNVKIGSVVEKETSNCLMISSEKKIACIGLEDLIIIETKEVILVAKKSESQKIKDFLQELPKNHSFST